MIWARRGEGTAFRIAVLPFPQSLWYLKMKWPTDKDTFVSERCRWQNLFFLRLNKTWRVLWQWVTRGTNERGHLWASSALSFCCCCWRGTRIDSDTQHSAENTSCRENNLWNMSISLCETSIKHKKRTQFLYLNVRPPWIESAVSFNSFPWGNAESPARAGVERTPPTYFRRSSLRKEEIFS